jgi:hypothetical protein
VQRLEAALADAQADVSRLQEALTAANAATEAAAAAASNSAPVVLPPAEAGVTPAGTPVPADLMVRIATLEASVASLETENKELLARLEDRGEESDRVAGEFAAEVRALNKELSDARANEATLAADVEALRLSARRTTRELHEATDALTASKSRVQELEGNVARLNADLAAMVGDADSRAGQANRDLERERAHVALLQQRCVAVVFTCLLACLWYCVVARNLASTSSSLDLRCALGEDLV